MRRVRAVAGLNQDTPMVAVTGSGSDKDIEACLAAGADAHVVKPIEPSALHQAIHAAIAQQGLRSRRLSQAG